MEQYRLGIQWPLCLHYNNGLMLLSECYSYDLGRVLKQIPWSQENWYNSVQTVCRYADTHAHTREIQISVHTYTPIYMLDTQSNTCPSVWNIGAAFASICMSFLYENTFLRFQWEECFNQDYCSPSPKHKEQQIIILMFQFVQSKNIVLYTETGLIWQSEINKVL